MLSAAALAKRGFDVPTLSTYLATGMAPQGTSFAQHVHGHAFFDQCDGTGGRQGGRHLSAHRQGRQAGAARRVSRTVAASRRS